MKKTYDVFISSRSSDYSHAEELRNFLINNGRTAFLASKELQSIGEAEYAKVIDEALDQCHHLIVISTSIDNIMSKWVYHEWSTFSNDIKSGYREGNLLTVLSDTIELRSLPASLRHQQSFPITGYRKNILDYLRPSDVEEDNLDNPFEIFDAKVKSGNTGSINSPFLMPIEDVFQMSAGVVVTGIIESGEIAVGDTVEIVGFGKKISAKCKGIEMSGKLHETAKVGDNVGLLLECLSFNAVRIGQVVARPSFIDMGKAFSCDCYFFLDEKHPNYKISSDLVLSFLLRAADVPGKLVIPTGYNKIQAGDYLPLRVNLFESVPLNRGEVFLIRRDAEIIGIGIVKSIKCNNN